jgi:rhamnosyltransferase
MSAPYVSIVVPTFNGMATLPRLLDTIAAQRADFPYELIAVDSGSVDGTPDLLRARGHQIISITPGSFDHGLARNEGIRHARGAIVVMIVQDALPAADNWLILLTSPFRDDPRLAGTFARQRPNAAASPLARVYLAGYAAASPVPRVSELADAAEFASLTPGERLMRCTFDNVCACVRRAVWEEHPFKATPIAEDVEWARDVMLAGYRLRYVPEAEVFHSHDRPATYEFKRTYILHFRLYQLFGLRTIPTLPTLARAIGSCVRTHWKHQPGLRALTLACVWPLGQYLGALTAANGWKPLRPGAV